ncbi:hypothetical protein GCM10009828_032800 [Actinoplanes couchii]|uniref:Uncharacterized protein n=1 Tax=Actinoplanes couchii TaxID=403638 RepID=A0ABQ3XBH7_9ACTN|nr:hypothetical protein Aco03nite_041590 [Actinoplanes couchii]
MDDLTSGSVFPAGKFFAGGSDGSASPEDEGLGGPRRVVAVAVQSVAAGPVCRATREMATGEIG